MGDRKGTKEVIFEDEINNESVAELINVIDSNDDKKLIKIYLTTTGGNLHSAEILIRYINRKVREGQEIELVATWEVSSSGFFVLCKTICKISFLDAWSTVHIGTNTVDYRESLKPKSQQKFLLKHIKKVNEKILEAFKDIGLTEKELKDISDGKDIILEHDRLIELFN